MVSISQGCLFPNIFNQPPAPNQLGLYKQKICVRNTQENNKSFQEKYCICHNQERIVFSHARTMQLSKIVFRANCQFTWNVKPVFLWRQSAQNANPCFPEKIRKYRRKYAWNVEPCFPGEISEYHQFVVSWIHPEIGED